MQNEVGADFDVVARFADVEFFGFIALIAGILGVATLFAAKKLSISGKA